MSWSSIDDYKILELVFQYNSEEDSSVDGQENSVDSLPEISDDLDIYQSIYTLGNDNPEINQAIVGDGFSSGDNLEDLLTRSAKSVSMGYEDDQGYHQQHMEESKRDVLHVDLFCMWINMYNVLNICLAFIMLI